MSLYEVVMSKY